MSIKITKAGPALGEAAIAGLERRLGRTLPNDYRSFLLKYNGGVPELNSFPIPQIGEGGINAFFGIREGKNDDDLEAERRRMKDRMPKHLLPIAEAEGGNLVCISFGAKDHGSVYFWDHEEEADEDELPDHTNLYKLAE